jgi:type IV pilus assembly protein PilZ
MATNPRKGILSVKITDTTMLYHSFMPFLKHGGLFIPTTKSYKIGDEVFILLTLLDESEKIPVAGNVAWITPRGAQGNQTAGVGVHFSDVDGGAAVIRGKIENYLVDKMKSDKSTYTM